MGSDDRVEQFVGRVARKAGRQLEEAKQAYRNARGATRLPSDGDGRVRIVCRRYAERRAVDLDDLARPECFDSEHPDCRGCLEDIREGVVETW